MHWYVRDDRVDIRPEARQNALLEAKITGARRGAKIATYAFPVAAAPYAHWVLIYGTWTIESDAPERYKRTDSNNTLRIPPVLPDTLLGFRGVVKVGTAEVSTFVVPWTLVAAPASARANTHVHVEQGYYMTIPNDAQDSYGVLLIVQRQAVDTHEDAIYFRGCGNNIPAGVTVELYEWMA